jgi:alpha-glucosidase (family GH31 glycosyl hydrolase)
VGKYRSALTRTFQEWYTNGHKHFLDDGVDFWWNDEGETQWFTYYWWNLAQQAQWTAQRPRSRMFTINRAFRYCRILFCLVGTSPSTHTRSA